MEEEDGIRSLSTACTVMKSSVIHSNLYLQLVREIVGGANGAEL